MEHGDTGSETRQIENHFITPTTNLEHIWWWQKLPWWCYRSLPACPCESCGCVWHVLCLVSRSICQNIFNIKFKYHLRGKYHHHQRLVNFPKPSGETVWLTWFYWRFWAIIPHLHFLIGALPPPITAELWSSVSASPWLMATVVLTWHWGCCLRPQDSGWWFGDNLRYSAPRPPRVTSYHWLRSSVRRRYILSPFVDREDFSRPNGILPSTVELLLMTKWL